MDKKLTSLLLLLVACAVGVLSPDIALAPGKVSQPISLATAVFLTAFLFAAVCGWYRYCSQRTRQQ